MTEPVAVGLAGAGPWATIVHAPMLAAGPETRLAGVWARRSDAAEALAGAHGAPAFTSFDALVDDCDAVAFAVPPDVQPDLAVRAARAGRAVLLEKPLAADVDGARRVADAVGEAGVGSLVVLTYRFLPQVRDFLEQARDFDAVGGRGCVLSGAFLGGPFAQSPWRRDRGSLLDVGPHVVDLLDAALGPVVEARASGDRHGWITVGLTHEGGRHSDVSITCHAAIQPSRTEVELFGPGGSLCVDGRLGDRNVAWSNLRADFAAVARGACHPLDAQRGLHLQRVIAEAEAQLA